MNPKQLRDQGDYLFGKQKPILSLWQDIADHFYVERANFTLQRSIGMDFAANLYTSFPSQCRRDLGNAFGTMLRPVQKPWFHVGVRNATVKDHDTRQYLQAFEETQRRAMYDPITKFTRATKEADHDFATFGQCSISTELNRDRDGLLYRCWHLRDMTWAENEEGDIGPRFRRWKPTLLQLCSTFPKEKLHQDYVKRFDESPFDEANVMHMVVEADLFDDKTTRPYWSVWFDCDHDVVIDKEPIWTGYYRIPRWQTVSGSQYSYSPATCAALPDARLIQAMTFTLLEAGEKATNPPLIATIDAVRSDMATYAGGVVWVDPEYDERMGEALRPITQDLRGFNFGVEMNKETRAMINSAFYLNKLVMPQRTKEMTAYEVGQMVQQYVRDALPLFEPMENDYNAGICEDAFELLWRNGAFGSPLDWPKQLRGAQIGFTFESPLHDAIEENKGQLLLQGQQITAQMVGVDPSSALVVDYKEALRDALYAIGYPATWIRPPEAVAQIEDMQRRAAQAQTLLDSIQKGAAAAKDIGSAHESVVGAPA